MGIKALDLNATFDYVSESDTEEPKTIWKLGVLDTRIRKMLEDIAWEYEAIPGQPDSARAKATFNIGKAELDFVAYGLKGFENFTKADSKQLYFKTEPRVIGNKQYNVVAEEILRQIPGNIIKELANKIKDVNNVDEDERKN